MMNRHTFYFSIVLTGLLAAGCSKDDAASSNANTGMSSGQSDMMMNAEDMDSRDEDMDSRDEDMDSGDMSIMEPDMPQVPEGCDCPEPPSPSCQDGSTRKLYSTPGCGDTNTCLDNGFIERTEACDSPPETACMGEDAVVTYLAQGSCEGGQCVYTEQISPCQAQADVCIDDQFLKRFVGVPSCEDGECTQQETIEDCGDLGCCEDGCCAPVPSNTEAYGAPYTTGVVTGPPNGNFDTDDDCTQDAILGICEKVDSTDTSDACVCFSDSLIISDLKVSGSRALVLMASDSIEVRGTLDLSADSYVSDGPGNVYVYNEASVNSSAKGGSYASLGGRDANGQTIGTPSLEPLTGGCRGQSVCTDVAQGGRAGGALQMTATNTIKVTGIIAANGGGGEGGGPGTQSCLHGAGGGSGGGILIEAPQVEISGTILAQGGGGGGGGTSAYSGFRGSNGELSVTRAQGGSSRSEDTCPLYSDVYSGSGGSGATRDNQATAGGGSDSETRCLNANIYAGAGGGGGGLGYIRVNTRLGAQACLCGGSFSPAPSFGMIEFD